MKGEMHMADVRVNRKFKDSLFRMIFSEKEALRSSTMRSMDPTTKIRRT